MILVDGDTVAPSNLNRQIHATFATIGQSKTKVMKKRIESYRNDCEVITQDLFYNATKNEEVFKEPVDFVVDAIAVSYTHLAIRKVTKNHKLPDYLNCLILENLVFFQAPIYLSEIGVAISNKVESYIYLDKDDMFLTSKILKLANEIGSDMWSSLFHEQTHDFMIDAQINLVNNIHDKICLLYTSVRYFMPNIKKKPFNI